MKYNSFISLLIGAIVLFGTIAGDTSYAALPVVSVKITDSSVDADHSPPEKKVFQFNKVNNITLYDDQKIVVEKLGLPQSITKDSFIQGMETYAYPEMNIGFNNGMLEYVEVLAAAGTIQIDDVVLPINLQDLKKALGEPDYIAEDGIVYQHNEALIKIFIDESTQKATSIDYYPLSST